MAWLGTWSKRRKITIDNTNIDSDLTHFPIPIVLGTSIGQSSQDVSDIFDEVGSSYLKIAITKVDGTTQIYGDVELWDSGTENAVIHVAKSDLDIKSASVTELYIYYDVTQDDNTTYISLSGGTAAQSVYKSDDEIVLNMNQEPITGSATILDSTSNNNDATPFNTGAGNLVDADIGRAINFNVTSQYLSASSLANNIFDGGGTVEVVIDPDNDGQTNLGEIVGKRSGGWYLRVQSELSSEVKIGFGFDFSGGQFLWSTNSRIPIGSFSSVSVTYNSDSDANDPTIYIDGVSVAITEDNSGSGTRTDDSSATFEVGNWHTNSRAYDGSLALLKLASTIRSADWSKARYYALIDDLLTFSDTEINTQWLSGWDKRIKLTVDNSNIDSDLTHFPVAVVLSSTHGDSVFDELVYTDVDDDFTGTDDDPPNTDLWEDYLAYDQLKIYNNTLTPTIINTYCMTQARFKLTGDFDVQIDTTMPSSITDERLDLNIKFDDPDGTDRIQFYRENNTDELLWYISFNDSTTNGDANIIIASTKLRLTRVGDLFTFYYDIGAGWVNWYSTTKAFSTEARVYFFSRTVSLYNTYYDNFQVNSGTVIWPENTNPNRKKIAFTTNDGMTQLYGDVEIWDDANENAVIHVSKENWEILSSENTDFYMYYDSTQDDNTDYIGDSGGVVAQSVYDSDFKNIQNMNQDPSGSAPQMLDSTLSNNDCTTGTAMDPQDLVDGDIGKAIEFEGINDYLKIVHADASDFDFGNGDFTVTMKVNPDVLVDNVGLIGKGDYDAGGWFVQMRADGSIRLAVSPTGSPQSYYASVTGTLVTGAWQVLTFVKDGSVGKIYKTGAEVSYSVTDTLANVRATTENFQIAAKDTGQAQFFNGPIEYCRVSNIAESAAWIKATNYALTDDLLTYGTEESEAQVSTPVIDPTSGEYLASQQITITCGTSGATIYYTEDGSDPDNTDTEYTAPFTLSTAKTIKAIAIKAGLDDSEIVSETYTIGTGISIQPMIFIIIN